MKNVDMQKRLFNKGFDKDETEKSKRCKESADVRIEKLNGLMRDLSGKIVLNLGCGNGDFLDEKFIMKNRLIGIDISMNSLKNAVKYGYVPVLSDAETGLPLKDSSMDVVVASEVLEHIVSTDLFLFEINRVLKKDGLLFLTTPNINTILSYIMMIFLDMPPYRSARYKSPHVKDFTRKTLGIALTSNGFVIKEFVGSAIFIPYLGYFLKKTCDLIPRMGETLIVKAVKKESLSVPDMDMRLFLS